MSSNKLNFPKLTSSKNYPVWVIRMEALLIKEKLLSAIETAESPKSKETLAHIRLRLNDGLLIQTKHINNAKEM